MNDTNSNLPGGRPPNDPTEGLTCSEGQIEDLLSEGESTEAESEEGSPPEESSQENTSSQKPASPSASKHPKK